MCEAIRCLNIDSKAHIIHLPRQKTLIATLTDQRKTPPNPPTELFRTIERFHWAVLYPRLIYCSGNPNVHHIQACQFMFEHHFECRGRFGDYPRMKEALPKMRDLWKFLSGRISLEVVKEQGKAHAPYLRFCIEQQGNDRKHWRHKGHEFIYSDLFDTVHHSCMTLGTLSFLHLRCWPADREILEALRAMTG